MPSVVWPSTMASRSAMVPSSTRKRAVHVGFAELELGIEQHAALRGLGHEADGDGGPRAVADGEDRAARRGEPEGSAAHESPQQPSPAAGPSAAPIVSSGPACQRLRGAGSKQPAEISPWGRAIRPNSRFQAMRGQSLAMASLSRDYGLNTGFALDPARRRGAGRGQCCRK